METEAPSGELTFAELIGLMAAVLTAVVFVGSVVMTERGGGVLRFELSSVAFAAVAGAATYGLAKDESHVGFGRALWVAAGAGVVAVVITGIEVWRVFTPPTAALFGTFLVWFFATSTVPVVLVYLWGAATTSRQRTILAVLMAAVPLGVVIPTGTLRGALLQVGVYSANLLLGLPLAVLVQRYSE